MPNAHVEIRTTVRQSDNPKDYVVNNLYFTGGASTTADFQSLSDQISNIWKISGSSPNWSGNSGRGHQIKVYNMADAKPRPVAASTTYTPASWATGTMLPRQICIVLSYYADRNLPRTRGRIYVGPWDMIYVSGERVVSTTMQVVLDLGKKLAAIATVGAAPWFHAVHSQVANTFLNVNHYYVNDVYDTQRRRTPKEITRVRYDV